MAYSIYAGTDPILELWSANVSCSSQGDNVSVSYNDNGFTAHSVLPIQVQMKCHRPAEDGDSITHPQVMYSPRKHDRSGVDWHVEHGTGCQIINFIIIVMCAV